MIKLAISWNDILYNMPDTKIVSETYGSSKTFLCGESNLYGKYFILSTLSEFKLYEIFTKAKNIYVVTNFYQ